MRRASSRACVCRARGNQIHQSMCRLVSRVDFFDDDVDCPSDPACVSCGRCGCSIARSKRRRRRRWEVTTTASGGSRPRALGQSASTQSKRLRMHRHRRRRRLFPFPFPFLFPSGEKKRGVFADRDSTIEGSPTDQKNTTRRGHAPRARAATWVAG